MRDDDNEQQLVGKIEVAAREFQSVADELRTIVADLPRKARPYGNHLTAIAVRLDGIAGQLGTEVMLRPDPEFADGLIKSGRRALKLLVIGGLAVGGMVVTGAAEEIGAGITDRIAAIVIPAESAASEAEQAIQIALTEPAHWEDEIDPDRIVGPWSEPLTVTTSALGYSGTQTAKVTGISYRQLDYWARTGLIRPSLSDSTGSGSRSRYSYNDLLELKAIKKLLDAGIKLEQVRKVFEYLREHLDIDIASANIVIDGASVMLADGDQLVDVLKNGQGTLSILSLGGVRDELEADLAPDENSED